MQIKKVTSASLLSSCRRFLAQDPVVNVLPLGDLYSPLLKVSDVYSAIEKDKIVGVSTIYRAFSTPSIALGNAPSDAKQALIKKVLNETTNKFISLCQLNDIDLFKKYSTLSHSHIEQQMITDHPRHFEHNDIKVERVDKQKSELLNKFYVAHQADAWAPIQFKTGPYYCVRHNGEIVSAAGVHLVTPQIAQLGNIITDEVYRNLGFATACTSRLATELAVQGRIISLFVKINNASAIHTYEKLGFSKNREIAFIIMQKS